MSLKAQINDATKAAMKAGDKSRLSTLRMTNAAIKQREVDDRIDLTDADIVAIIEKMIKQRRESIAQFEKAERDDLVQAEAAEIEVLQEFMPQALSEEETRQLVDDKITACNATSMQDMGAVMSALREAAAGRIDMQKASAMVRQQLS